MRLQGGVCCHFHATAIPLLMASYITHHLISDILMFITRAAYAFPQLIDILAHFRRASDRYLLQYR